MENKYFHSVTLDKDKCIGCTVCIKRCPTEAIRVRNGKAYIIPERCIDCGACIRVCPHHAKKAISNPLQMITEYKYRVALPAPSLYGQFNNLDDIDIVLNGLCLMGFDDVYEVSSAAEIVSDATRKLISENAIKKPVISSACPAVVRLIRVRFPDLCENVLSLDAPMEVAAGIARKKAIEETGYKSEEIGVFFITPCAAKVTAVRSPIGIEKSNVDGAISINEIYTTLATLMGRVTENFSEMKLLSESGVIGVSWAGSGGESAALLNERYLAADGIGNVIRVLEELEDERIRDLDFIELNACAGGCVGGVLAVENAYVAKARLQRLRKYLPFSKNHINDESDIEQYKWEKELEFEPGAMELSDDISEAMRMLRDIGKLRKELPGLDCGSCGSPSCRTLAEDIIKGNAQKTDCLFVMREQIKSLAATLTSMGVGYIPQHHEEESVNDSSGIKK